MISLIIYLIFYIIPEKQCRRHVFSDKNDKIVLKILFMFARDMRRQKVYVSIQMSYNYHTSCKQ